MNIQNAIDTYIKEHSNFDTKRAYLGMSRLSECPRKIYNEYLYGSTVHENTYRMSYAGYEQERCILEMLTGSGVARTVKRELVAPFDERLRGHIDAELVEGDLLEIKSVSMERFQKVSREHRPLLSHAVQVQMYMRYGGYRRAFLVYRNRETYEHLVLEVLPDLTMQRKYEEKASRLLDAIDQRQVPECVCGRCE